MKPTLSVLAVLLAIGAAPVLAQSRPVAPPQGGPLASCQSPKGHNSAACKPQPQKHAGPGKGHADKGKPHAQPGKGHPPRAEAPRGKPQPQHAGRHHPAPHHAAPARPMPPKVEPIRVRIGEKVDKRFKRHTVRSPKLERGYDYYELGDKLFRVDPTTEKILAVVGLIEAFSR